jgi:CMP-N,N'-diacetyllegionaminic acid synthase
MRTRGKILWLITARSGSKSIPDKNVKRLGGLPLLAYRIQSALKIAKKRDVWVSTDSRRYAGIAKSFGAQVPFIRPAHLASDSAKSVDVALHAMRWAHDAGLRYDALGLLEPTSPFIKTQYLREAMDRLFSNSKATGIVATRRVRPSTFFIQKEAPYISSIAKNIKSKGVLRRQDEEKEITPSGGFYISKWAAFLRLKSFFTKGTLSFLVPDPHGLEIDEPIDWLWAEFLIKKIIKKKELFR